jgi:hypothetical protein
MRAMGNKSFPTAHSKMKTRRPMMMLCCVWMKTQSKRGALKNCGLHRR